MSKEEKVPQPAPPPATDEIVDKWFVEHFHNHGPLIPVELTNHFIEAKNKLKKLLASHQED